MPGIYEVLEWIVTAQPKSPLDLPLLKVKFPMLDPTLLAYAESNVFAMLSSYRGSKIVDEAGKTPQRYGGIPSPTSSVQSGHYWAATSSFDEDSKSSGEHRFGQVGRRSGGMGKPNR